MTKPIWRDGPVSVVRDSRRSSVAVVSDRPELRSAVAALAAGRQHPTAVAMFTPADLGRAWADCDSLILGTDAVAAARPLIGAVNRPSRVVVARSGAEDDQGAEQGAWLPGIAAISLPQARAELSRWLEGSPASAVPGAVAVVGGRGGAGASTAAIALARAAARVSDQVALIDADPMGGGLDLALGMEAVPGARWPDLVDLRGADAGRWLLASLPAADGIALVSQDRRADQAPVSAEATAAVLDAALTSAPAVVVDLPRHRCAQVSIVLARCSILVVVVPAELRACAAAAGLVASIAAGIDDVRLLVRGPSPVGLSAEDVAEAVGVPTFAEVRGESGVAAALDQGEAIAVAARSPLRRWADALVASWRGASPPWWEEGTEPPGPLPGSTRGSS